LVLVYQFIYIHLPTAIIQVHYFNAQVCKRQFRNSGLCIASRNINCV